MKRFLVAVVMCCVGSVVATAQIDDLAESSWAVPELEALERFKENPLCLRCARASDLTILPGIGRRTASAIVTAVASGTASVQHVAEMACLSTDQTLIVQLATTLDCSCVDVIEQARIRTRVFSYDASLESSGRLDATIAGIRLGGVTTSRSPLTLGGAWATTSIGNVSVFAGNHAVSVGGGLVLGTASGFGRSVLARAQQVETSISVRPWTSSLASAALRGAAVVVNDINVSNGTLNLLASVSQDDIDGSSGIAASVAAIYSVDNTNIGLTSLSTPTINAQSVVASVHNARFVVDAEVALMQNQAADVHTVAVAGVSVLRYNVGRSTVFAGARWLHPEFSHRYGNTLSSRSTLGNESGLMCGVHLRSTTFSAEIVADVRTVLSRAYGKPLPASGIDFICDGSIKLSQKTHLNFRLRHDVADDGSRQIVESRTLLDRRHRSTLRGELDVWINNAWRLRARADLRLLQWQRTSLSETGHLVFAELSWQNKRVRTMMRYTVFHAPSIDAAAYTLEVPMPGLLQTVAGVGSGSRLLLSARYAVTSWATLHTMMMVQNKIDHESPVRLAVQTDVRF